MSELTDLRAEFKAALIKWEQATVQHEWLEARKRVYELSEKLAKLS